MLCCWLPSVCPRLQAIHTSLNRILPGNRRIQTLPDITPELFHYWFILEQQFRDSVADLDSMNFWTVRVAIAPAVNEAGSVIRETPRLGLYLFGVVQAKVTLSVRPKILKVLLDSLFKDLSLTQSVTLTEPKLNHAQERGGEG